MFGLSPAATLALTFVVSFLLIPVGQASLVFGRILDPSKLGILLMVLGVIAFFSGLLGLGGFFAYGIYLVASFLTAGG